MPTEFHPSETRHPLPERQPDIPAFETKRETGPTAPELQPRRIEGNPSADTFPQVPHTPTPSSVPADISLSPEVVRIETILSEGLEETYNTMDPALQQEFRVKGEEAAVTIAGMLKEAKVKVRGIIRLITDWLKLIPGVSKFFIEQEAKIKTDRLLSTREEARNKHE